MKDKVNLDSFCPKEAVIDNSANLPAYGIIAADLEAALEEFAAIEEDLKE